MPLPTEDHNEQSYYYPPAGKTRSRTGQIAILAIAVGVLVVGGWWLSHKPQQPAEPVVEAPVVEPVIEPVLEETPEPEPEQPAVAETPEPIEPEPQPEPLPSLDNSDEFVRGTLLDISDRPTHQGWLKSDNLIRRVTAITDGLSRGELLQKFMPLQSPQGKFEAEKHGEAITISSDNYQRYNTVVDNLIAIEPQQLANTIQQLQPLMENAFEEQGYPDRTFKNALLEAIDELLATPSYQQPPELLLESVHYTFKDVEIEALSEAQKQLVRSGPENTRKLQGYLQQLRIELQKPQ